MVVEVDVIIIRNVPVALSVLSGDPSSAEVGQEERQGPARQGREGCRGRKEIRMGHRVRHGLRRAPDHLEREGGLAVKAAVYARVSTSNGSQTCENQLLELRRYCEARGWTVYAEYTDEMSGAKDRRPGLDRLLLDARRARVQVVVCWALDSNRARPETPPGGAGGPAVAEHPIRFAEGRFGLGIQPAAGSNLQFSQP